MKTGITLQQAIEKAGINPNDLEGERAKEKAKHVDAICDQIDKIIEENILTLLQRPLACGLSYYGDEKEIQKRYNDFTISFGSSFGGASIKLADKDWDWDGYGIKREPIHSKFIEPIVKKRWWQF